MSIYTITLVYSPDEKRITGEDVHRCVGYFNSETEAIKSVESNEGEMHECRYDHVIIEEIPEGVWRQALKESWYVWDADDEAWISCEKPLKYREFATITGFGMG